MLETDAQDDSGEKQRESNYGSEQRSGQDDAQQRSADSSSQRSLLGRAKQAINKASSRASSSAEALGTKAVSLGVSSAATTANIGKQTYSTAGDVARDAVDAGKQIYSGSRMESAVDFIDSELEKRGAKQALQETTEAVFGKLDQVTGKRLLEMLEQKLQLQDAYNDILATRLAEALERITELEAKFSKLTPQAPSTAHFDTTDETGCD